MTDPDQLAAVPAFPDTRPVACTDAALFRTLLARRPCISSVYSFTNIYTWRTTDHTRLTSLDGALLVSDCLDGATVEYLEPLGVADPAAVLRRLAVHPAAPQRWCGKFITAGTAAALADTPQFILTRDPNHDDYVYTATDLIELPGRKYDSKRNHLNRLRRELSYDYVPLTPDTAPLFRDFAGAWCRAHGCADSPDLQREYAAIAEMLANPCGLGLSGGAIRSDGRLLAITLGEHLTADTFVVYVEKADTTVDGLYQLINQEFAAHAAAGAVYINREQDLGIPGLRRAKQSYHPHHMVEVYRLTVR
ncbi:MAG TPA: phosphatidylglycerol lysyltransferase domain-containing protein [bacterium]|mgnify:CR=1 FL=1|nr:phosphatidylglycerol lysyltransferase domain-containing protein [bacterium]